MGGLWASPNTLVASLISTSSAGCVRMGACLEKEAEKSAADVEAEAVAQRVKEIEERRRAATERKKQREEEKKREIQQAKEDEIAMANTRLFSVPVTLAAERSDPTHKVSPVPVATCMKWIQRHGLDEEGLFRIPGSLLEVNKYKRRFNLGEYDLEIPEDESVENVASIIIRYLNDLDPSNKEKEEVSDLYSKDWKSWMKLANKVTARDAKTKEERVSRAKTALIKLEPASAEVFRQIVVVLKEASEPEHSEKNMMTPKKFSLCTFPRVMGFVEELIVNYDSIFPLEYPNGVVLPPTA